MVKRNSFSKNKFSDCGRDQKKLFGIVNSLLGCGKKTLLPQHDDSLTLARLFNEFFSSLKLTIFVMSFRI